jgi:hypothetical protein
MTDYCCKIGRAAAEHDLSPPDDDVDGLDGYLVARWRGEGGYEPTGVRDLTDWFNTYILREAYIAAGRRVTSARVESEYAALTGDDATAREVRDDLAQDGIDPEALTGSFTSRSTMARHLRNCLDATKDTSADGDWERDSIAYSKQNAADHVAPVLSTLANKGRLPGADEASVSLQIDLSCPDCNRRVELDEALDRGYVCPEHLGRATAAGED